MQPLFPPIMKNPDPHENLDDILFEQTGLEFFFKDFCVESNNRSISRGFLDGLRSLVDHGGPASDLSQAARIVSLAGTGNRLHRPALLHKAELKFVDLLCTFQKTLSDPTASSTVESLMTAVMLGLYEV